MRERVLVGWVRLQATENILRGNWNHKDMYYPLKGMLSSTG